MYLPPVDLTLSDQLQEFDVWVTASLGELNDTDKFRSILALAKESLELLGAATDNFARAESCHPERIAEALAKILSQRTSQEREQILQSLGLILFLVTGKSDNNFKCQFPLFLRDQAGWREIPNRGRHGGNSSRGLPRTIPSESYLKLIASVGKDLEAKLLKQFIAFLLKDEDAINQFWSVGHSYFALKPFGRAGDLLAPLVTFTVRGSVMASGGHKPESLLRDRMTEWGLQAGVDFNLSDVVVIPEQADAEKKTRAYDFVLPYRTRGWPGHWRNRLFIQSQFYAGDSGSVSHKNVDQTETSRQHVMSFVRGAVFLEYVDGAGYFSSLNGDLKRLLRYGSTSSFFQIRSSAIRLRRELQQLGFLSPLEVEHALLASDGTEDGVTAVLSMRGITRSEIERAWNTCVAGGMLETVRSGYAIKEERRDIVRRYLLLDTVATHGAIIKCDETAGKLLVPGYGPFYGLALEEVAEYALRHAPSLEEDLNNVNILSGDVGWLSEQGLIITS